MWKVQPTDRFLVRRNDYEKKKEREAILRKMEVNLATYLRALQLGVNPLQIKYGWVHDEPMGVVGIDPGGRKPHRLYVYPEQVEEVLYQLTIGDKGSQNRDVQYCNECVQEIRDKIKSTKNEPQSRLPDTITISKRDASEAVRQR